MQLTLHATRRTPHGASRLVLAMFAWSVRARHAPSRHCRDARVYDDTTTAMHDNEYPPPPLPARATTPGREQSSILAQYILLLLTDYSIKGACNPDDQNFALELVRQGSQNKKNMSLFAVSKAMGFIPRHKLEHSFFRYDTRTRE